MSVAAVGAATKVAQFFAPEVLSKFAGSMKLFKDMFAFDIMTGALDKIMESAHIAEITAGPAGLIAAKLNSQTLEQRVELMLSLVRAIQTPAAQTTINTIAAMINIFNNATARFTKLFTAFQNMNKVSLMPVSNLNENFKARAAQLGSVNWVDFLMRQNKVLNDFYTYAKKWVEAHPQ